MVLTALIPIGYLVSLSLRPPADVLNSSLLPGQWTFANFTSVFDTIALGTMLANSWMIGGGAAALAVRDRHPGSVFHRAPVPR